MRYLLVLLIAAATVNLSHMSKPMVKRFIDEKTIMSSEKLKKLVEGNNGQPVPAGYHSYLVAFMKKPNFDNDNVAPTFPKDFSVNGPIFASGVLLSRKWALTRATPLAYYPLGSYSMMCQKSIIIPLDVDLMRLYEIDFVMTHPYHRPGDNKTDLALVRTAKLIDFSFVARSANLGFMGHGPTIGHCKLVVWSWFFQKDPDKRLESIDKGEIAFTVHSEGCSFDPNHFYCLTQSELKHQPCAINSGAPIMCDTRLIGIYAGDGGVVACDEPHPSKSYSVIRMNTAPIGLWLAESISSEYYEIEHQATSDEMRTVFKKCGSSKISLHFFFQLTILFSVLYT